MKKIIFILFCTCLGKIGFAQADSPYLYLRFPTVPVFSIVKAPDSTKFTRDGLSKKKATVIIIFSPDCEHCQHETKDLTTHIDLFKKAQIVMVSPLEYSYIKRFYDDYKIGDYPNIIMGRDPSYFFGTFFHARSLPAIFIYDKKGKFVRSFEGSVSAEKIAEIL